MSTLPPRIYWGHYDGPPPVSGFLPDTPFLTDAEDDLTDPATFVTHTTEGTNSTLVHEPFEGYVVAIAEFPCPVRILEAQATGRCRDIMASPLASTPSGHIELSYWNGTAWVSLGTPASLIAGFYWGTVNASITSNIVTRYVRVRVRGGISGKGAWQATTDIADFRIEAMPATPPSQIRWLALARPPLSSMVTTTLLQDGEVNDPFTGVYHSDSVTFGEGCAMHEIDSHLTAALSWDCPVQVSEVTARYGLSHETGDNIYCALPFPWDGPIEGSSHEIALEHSLDGATWTAVSGTPAFSSIGHTWTFSATVRHVRLVLYTWLRFYDQSDTYSASVGLTDFRALAGILAPTEPPANLRGLGVCEGPQLTWLWDPCGCCVGYEIEVDGGEIEDIGAVTTYVLSPVAVPSTHTLKVRGYNCGGVGPWAELELTSCTTTTDPPPDPDPEGEGCECAWVPANGPCAPWQTESGTPTTSWKKAGCV